LGTNAGADAGTLMSWQMARSGRGEKMIGLKTIFNAKLSEILSKRTRAQTGIQATMLRTLAYGLH
jgi:hypothetical protein